MSIRTREFTFPNGGHSVRKLVSALKDLGDVCVQLVAEKPQCYHREDQWEVCYEVVPTGVRAIDIINSLRVLGVTRFVYNQDNHCLDYHTKRESE